MRWLRHHAPQLGLDPQKIAAWGESAGGHLALILATTGNRPDLEGSNGVPTGSSEVCAAVSWYGPSDLSSPAPGSPQHLLLGGQAGHAAEASPLLLASPDSAPVLLIHGTEDSLVPVDNSERLAAAYTAHGAPVELIVLPGVGHAFAGSEPEPMVDTSLDYLQPFLDPTN